MPERIDLHLHLLPGVDDGAPDEAHALEHAARMVAAGVRAATVTPHVGTPCFAVAVDEIADRTRALQDALDRERIGLTLHPGGELHHAGAASLTDAELQLIAQGPPGRRWLLLEVPFGGIDEDFVELARELGARGFGLLIAHPERAAGVLHDAGLELVLPLLREGAVLQVNVCSLLGHHGPEAYEVARRLLCGRSAYVLASDGHPGSQNRCHTLADAISPARAAGATGPQVEQLLSSNPRLLLRDGLRPVRSSSPTQRHAPTPRQAAAAWCERGSEHGPA